MLSKQCYIIINDKFRLEEFVNILGNFANEKKLGLGVDLPLDYYIDDFHDYDVDSFISQIRQNYFEELRLPKSEIYRLKNETTMNLDFSIGLLYVPKNIDDIEKFIKLDEFSFVAIVIEENIVTNVFWYTEGYEGMVIIVDAENSSNFKDYLLNYFKENNKDMSNINE
ncbi:hypothetical protein [Romboutsia lituseburensis]|uniref:hypothetical protein n=1 Tax=Romboutsia lituseburensis TaxID=1537 RepID=UPI00215B3F49|nr:hypothetical protein [Romboutsia lituseburensis]MCR8747191.1 hypothetical protein [Romboutsia lituseburensis]